MTSKILLLLILTLSIFGCSNSSVKISGKFENPLKGQYIYLQELKAELITVDSLKLNEDGYIHYPHGCRSRNRYMNRA